jgi:nitrite reductase (NADH) large subunit
MSEEKGNIFTDKILIVGASAAGISAAKEIRKINSQAEVIIISDENHLPYYRPLLTRYIGDHNVVNNPTFYLNTAEWYRENRVELILGEKVITIDPSLQSIRTNKGREVKYDRLILATGSRPFVPIQGALDCENVFAVRTLDDAHAVHEYSKNSKNAVIIGGGLLGLEAADSLIKRNIHVSVVEMAERILPVQLDKDGSTLMESILWKSNVNLYLGAIAGELIGRPKVSAVRLSSGEEIPADMVLFSIGIRPNIELASEIGLETKKGILVNESMETKRPGIYACGDAAEYRKSICLWMPAIRQGSIAGLNAIGIKSTFEADEYPATLNSFGTKVFSVGDLSRNNNSSEYEYLDFTSEDGLTYKKLFFYDKVLVGGIFIGDTTKAVSLSKSIVMKMPMTQAQELLK